MVGVVILLSIHLRDQSGLWASSPEVLPLQTHKSMLEQLSLPGLSQHRMQFFGTVI